MSEDVENRRSAFAEDPAGARASLDKNPAAGAAPVEDSDLLRRYAETGAEDAFAEIVRRRIGLVYSVALRHTNDAHRAEDVTQRVFTDLARKAGGLAGRTVLVGWLYRSAQFAASNAVRTERRRQVREQEAYTMQQIEHDRPDPNWEKFRPVLDEVLNGMSECDRDAVLLRFFDGRGFAEIGAELRLTENAARRRVERALDKMHAALGRRGVTSTTAALGLALANSVGAAPPGLAVSVTGAALAGAAAAGSGATAAGALLGLKALVGGLGLVAALAVGAAVYQTGQVRSQAAALASVGQERTDLQARVASLEQQAQRADRRAQEAEKDNGELLKAVETLRANLAKGASGAAVAQVFASEEQQQLAYERAFQSDVAKRRGAELKRRADLDDEIARLTPEEKFNRLFEVAQGQADRAEFQQAIRTLTQAASVKPGDLPTPDKFAQLQAKLQAQNAPVEVTLTSDDMTFVAVGGVRAVGKFSLNTVRLPPGDYEVVGWRVGFQSVVVPLKIRAGAPVPPLAVSCTEPAAN